MGPSIGGEGPAPTALCLLRRGGPGLAAWGAMGLHWQSVAAVVVALGWYVAAHSLLQWAYYRGRGSDVAQWKIQPLRDESLRNKDRSRSWFLPLVAVPRPIDRVTGRIAPYPALIPTVQYCAVPCSGPRVLLVVTRWCSSTCWRLRPSCWRWQRPSCVATAAWCSRLRPVEASACR